MHRIGIKIGSNLLTNGGTSVDKDFILSICKQIVKLTEDGHQVFLVSSGAVASDPKSYRSRNLRAAIGQVRIIGSYMSILEDHGFEVAQMLITKKYLDDPRVFLRTAKEALQERNVILVINANDVVDDEEVNALGDGIDKSVCELGEEKKSKALGEYTDNDKLFAFVCHLLNASIALIGFDQKGLKDLEGNVINTVLPSAFEKVKEYAIGGSTNGRGKEGMKVKLRVATELATAGIETMLVPAKEEDAILKSVERITSKGEEIGTLFVPLKHL